MASQWERPEKVFTVDRSRAAFVIIDMQNFACAPDSGSALSGVEEVVERINSLAEACRSKDVPIVWVRQNFTSKSRGDDGGLYSLFHDDVKVKNITDRADGTKIYSPMDVNAERDHVVFKNRYSAFLSDPPELREKLNDLGRTQLIVAGVAANVCVESTVRDAMQIGYEVVLASDGTTAPSDVILESTISNIRNFFGDVRLSDEIINEL